MWFVAAAATTLRVAPPRGAQTLIARCRTAQVPQRAAGSDVVFSREIFDIDAMADEKGDGIGGDYLQLDTRPFWARWTLVNLPASVLQFTREDVASLYKIRTPSDKWRFFIPLRMPDGVRWDGCAVSPDCYVVCPPSSEGLVLHAGAIEFAIVSVAALDAVDLVDAIRGRLTTALRACVIRPPVKEARALASSLIEVRTTLRLLSDTLTGDSIEEIAVRLHGALERCLRGAAIGELKKEHIRSPSSIVRRTEQFYREHLGERVSISELSMVAGVSERSLRNAFHQVCMTSPKKYLRLLALHQVRRSLRAAPDAHAAVTTAAARHGFYEFGRFAAQYRAVFGEAPSETLHRARRGQVVARPLP